MFHPAESSAREAARHGAVQQIPHFSERLPDVDATASRVNQEDTAQDPTSAPVDRCEVHPDQASPPDATVPVAGDDMELVLALREGRPGAAEALYRRLLPSVRSALWRVLRKSTADCDDLIQITLERVITTVVDGRYKGGCSLPSWATSIATHAAVDYHRARWRERRLFDDEWSSESGVARTADAERWLIARSELGRVRDTLARMRPLDAQALLLCYGLGHSVAETAAELGASEYAVASRLSRARRDLLRRASHGLEEI
jgi:RNA polymerase sigma factor (sigma-70 family)